MYGYQSLRKCISNNDNELIIYGADNFSQFPRRDASVNSKCDRALPVARRDDLVVLRGKLDHEYHKWLRSHGLGSDHVVEYNAHSREMTLSELIVNDPEPVKKIIRQIGKKPVYVPWFSGRMETEAANALGSDLFGATETATLKYNDKSAFKTVCRQLGVSVVEGTLFEMHPENNKNCIEMKNIINGYLSTCKTVIIRGTLGEAGMSLYKTKGNDISEIYHEIAVSGEKSIIIEPFLNVFSSPTDQWVINRDGNINSLGMRDQICERGMVHIGTLKGAKTSPDILNYITKTSAKIVNNMAEFGYRGVVGIDYIVSDDGIFPVENNARFNASSYVSMIVDNIEELISPIPYWKFIKIKTAACSFLELTERIKPVLYDGKKLNSVFPFNCDTLPLSGDFAVILLAENMDEIYNMEESLKEMGVKRV
ncbi:Carbamoylphosphate synthase large subunit [Methanococcoides vulcani]|uniref:Carbamoylphosphate synthase large subunit n=1 Tax=Methanococcoides vulcani TaxID=1353158 RepID=A0A1H9ZX76_9EURY|nr:hypothetical protein [Methanococcoides vulcani]SES85504.1 Carbamoylphosphate synthase large subunit [Methanococcoides vulcani]